MLYRAATTVFLIFCCCLGSPAQQPVIQYFHPLFSPALPSDASLSPKGTIRALVVGLGRYQQDSMGDLAYPRRDAEAFAAFLKTPAGGSPNRDDLVLLTNEAATLAAVTNALDWIVRDSRMGDKIVVFFSLCGKLQSRRDARLLFYDSPPAPTDAGYLSLSRLTALLSEAANRNGARVFLALDIRPFNPKFSGTDNWEGSDFRSGLYFEKWAITSTTQDSTASAQSFGQILLGGLLGLADLNTDEKVHLTELQPYLQSELKTQKPANGYALLATSDQAEWLCKSRSYAREKLLLKNKSGFTPILQLEVQPLDVFMTEHADANTRKLYEDFILTIRLGQLLRPPGRCAAALLDSLLLKDSLAPVYRQLQRRMAVAYQDEAQQAINAYLQTSAKELDQRRKDPTHYQLYPQYLQRTLEILGPQHFMVALLKAKQLYFEALALRLEFQQTADPGLLPQAMQKSWQAIALEPEAAFVFNEMGVASYLMNHMRAAEQYFLLARDLSPMWGIPCSNLSLTMLQQNRLEEADSLGTKAIQLNPWNPMAYNNLGEVLQKKGALGAADSLYRRALRMNPELIDAHYNLARLHAQNQQPELAIESLRQALRYGFVQREAILTDPELAMLQEKGAFWDLMGEFFPEKK